MSDKETTFENAKEGDRVYSPLFKCKNLKDKTNGVISSIEETIITYLPDIRNKYEEFVYFRRDGTLHSGGGQVLFWENPIKEIPVKPKRKITKKGWIGICTNDKISKNCIATTTFIYNSAEFLSGSKNNIVQQIEFEVEE